MVQTGFILFLMILHKQEQYVFETIMNELWFIW